MTSPRVAHRHRNANPAVTDIDVTFAGVRGSTPVSGAQFARYGGRTSCVAIARPGQQPVLLLDAGTGVQTVDEILGGEAFNGSILLTHLHWDHMIGLPFFTAADRPDARAALYVPEQADPIGVLEQMMSPPHFPIGPRGLRGTWSFNELAAGAHDIEGFRVAAADIPHGGGRTFGFRVTSGNTSIAYLPDHAPLTLGPGPDGVGEYHPAALALTDNADLLIHDAQFTADELPAFAHYGHSTIDYAVGLAEHANVQRLALFHHAPSRSDDEIERLATAAAMRADVEVIAVADGLTLRVGRTSPKWAANSEDAYDTQ